MPASPTPTRERLLHALKTRGPLTAAALARRLGITPTAVRQHLDGLEGEGLVAAEAGRPRGAGRPARRWRTTPAADASFPESYADLALEMIAATRDAFGEAGLARLVEARTARQLAAYRERIPPRAPLAKRVAALAKLRREEGYLAEWRRSDGGALVLVENHCPVCAAARLCQGLCAGELELFRDALGPGVRVERTEHLLEGARRCAYRIEPA